MVRFVFEDSHTTIERLAEWIRADPFHQGSNCEEWATQEDNLIVACWVYDDKGPVMFLRADAEGDKVRLHIQFAPAVDVSQMRQVKAILNGWPRFLDTVTVPGVKGIVFQSISPSLIKFMKRMGFEDSQNENEYVLAVRE